MKFLVTLVLLFFTSFISFSQKNDNLEKLTSGKWNIESVEIDNQEMKVENEGHWMVFHANGIYQLYLDNEKQVGTWKLDEEKGLKFNNEFLNGESFIKNIDDKALRFSISGYTLALSK